MSVLARPCQAPSQARRHSGGLKLPRMVSAEVSSNGTGLSSIRPATQSRRPRRAQALDRRAARREVVAPHRHAFGCRVRGLVEVVRRALPGRCMHGAIDAVLLDQHAADARPPRRGDEAAQLGMMDADKHLHGAVDQDAAHQPVDRRRRVVGEHLLRAERDRQVVVVEHLLRGAVQERPEAQGSVSSPWRPSAMGQAPSIMAPPRSAPMGRYD